MSSHAYFVAQIYKQIACINALMINSSDYQWGQAQCYLFRAAKEHTFERHLFQAHQLKLSCLPPDFCSGAITTVSCAHHW